MTQSSALILSPDTLCLCHIRALPPSVRSTRKSHDLMAVSSFPASILLLKLGEMELRCGGGLEGQTKCELKEPEESSLEFFLGKFRLGHFGLPLVFSKVVFCVENGILR